jgi:hypothetical protein
MGNSKRGALKTIFSVFLALWLFSFILRLRDVDYESCPFDPFSSIVCGFQGLINIIFFDVIFPFLPPVSNLRQAIISIAGAVGIMFLFLTLVVGSYLCLFLLIPYLVGLGKQKKKEKSLLVFPNKLFTNGAESTLVWRDN